MPRIKMSVETGFAGEGHVDYFECEDELWNSMSPERREAYLDEVALEYLHERCACYAEVVES